MGLGTVNLLAGGTGVKVGGTTEPASKLGWDQGAGCNGCGPVGNQKH